MSELYGMNFDDLTSLARKVKEGRETLELSREDLAKMLGKTVAEIEYLEGFETVDMPDEIEGVPV